MNQHLGLSFLLGFSGSLGYQQQTGDGDEGWSQVDWLICLMPETSRPYVCDIWEGGSYGRDTHQSAKAGEPK